MSVASTNDLASGEAYDRRSEISKGIKDVMPITLGFFPMGLAFGLLVTQLGFAWWWAPIFSIIIYAGSMEFIALSMILSGVPWLSAAAMGFLVNFRHIFYGLTYPRHIIRPWWGKAYATYGLTDEVYALSSARPEDDNTSTRMLVNAVGCQISWVTPGIIGALLGQALPFEMEGLEFTLTALFVVLAYEAFDKHRDWSLLAIAVALSIIGAIVFPSQILVFALTGYFLMVLGRVWSPRLDAFLQFPRAPKASKVEE